MTSASSVAAEKSFPERKNQSVTTAESPLVMPTTAPTKTKTVSPTPVVPIPAQSISPIIQSETANVDNIITHFIINYKTPPPPPTNVVPPVQNSLTYKQFYGSPKK